ncbi:hypothetical protein BgiBS90_003080, partial [Biomphalaria glabrata]
LLKGDNLPENVELSRASPDSVLLLHDVFKTMMVLDTMKSHSPLAAREYFNRFTFGNTMERAKQQARLRGPSSRPV